MTKNIVFMYLILYIIVYKTNLQTILHISQLGSRMIMQNFFSNI